MKKIISVILSISIIISLSAVVMAENELVLISKGKSVTSSGYTFNLNASHIVDGNVNSLWSSNDAGNIWATVDLGEEYNIARIDVYPRMDMDQAGSRGNFSVQLSNDSEFQSDVVTVFSIGTQNHKEPAKVSPGLDEEYRYVRVFKNSGYLCLGEVMVFTDPNKKTDKIKTVAYKDVSGEDLNRLNLLTALDCVGFEVSENNFMPQNTVIREEFMYMLMRAVHKHEFKAQTDYFDDIAESFANREINNAVIHNYIASGGSFKPQDEITKEIALKIAAKALNYDIKLLAQGADIYEYIFAAEKMNLLDNVKFENDKMSRIDAVNFIHNILLSHPTNYENGSDGITFEEDEQSILERVHNVKYIEGIVTANEVTDINFNGELSKNLILINDEIFCFANGLEAKKDWLGQKVRAYYKNDNEIISIHAQKKQEVVKLDSYQISYSAGRYTNIEGSRKSYKLSEKRDIVYNGQAVGTVSNDQYVPNEGFVTLIDHNDDNEFDVIKIYDFKNNIVSNVNTEDEYITLKFGTEKFINLKDLKYSVYKNGQEVKLSSIKPEDIISVSKSMDGKYYEFYIGTESYDSRIKAVSKEKLDLVEPDISLRISNDFLNFDFLEPGTVGTVYLDYFGNAVYYSFNGENNLRYAYVYSMFERDEEDGNEICLRMFNTTGKGVYVLNEKSRICGTKYRTFEALKTAVNESFLDENGKFVPQMIRYRSDYDLYILEMYTSKYSESFTGNPDKTIKLLGGNPTTKTQSWYISDILGGRYVTDTDTMIFDIYNDGGEYSCTVRPVSYFTTLSTRLVEYSAVYGSDVFEPADVILKYQTTGSGNPTYMMYEKTGAAVDEDDCVQYLLRGYSKGKRVEYMTSRQSLLDGLDLKKGMVLAIRERDGVLNSVSIVYDPERDTMSGVNKISQPDDIYTDTENWFLSADVEKLNNGLVILSNNGGLYMFWNKSISGISSYNKDLNEIRGITAEELRAKEEIPGDYNKVIAHIRNGVVRDMFVY